MMHFTKKGMSHGKWNGVGGKVDAGESPEEAVIREVREETGLIIKNPLPRGMLSFIGEGLDKSKDWHVLVFTAKEFEGKPFKRTREGTLHWIKNSEIKNLNLWDDDKYWLHLLNQKRFFVGKFILDKNNECVEVKIKLH